MKLNQECIRDILLYIEENLTYENWIEASSLPLDKYSSEELIYTVEKLIEADFLNCSTSHYIGSSLPAIRIKSITYSGHQFLDNIRDDKVWKETKSIVSKVSSVSIQIISDVASKVITNIISKQMGLPT